MVNKIAVFSLLLWILLVSSCDKKTCCVNPPHENIDSISNGILIGNEGNFNWGNAGLSFLQMNSSPSIFVKDIYKLQNNKNLGDVLQSIYYYQDKIYLVVNNSGKIEILNKTNLKSEGSIIGLKSPRYMLAVYNTKAYVSDLYLNGITVVDLLQKEIKKTIPIKGWTEEMLLDQQQLYVCNKENMHVFVLNIQNDQLIDSLAIGYGSSSICKDHENKIWISCIGKDNTYPGKIVRLDPQSKQVIKEYNFPMNQPPGKLMFNPLDSLVYFQQQGIFKMSVDASTLPANPFIPAVNKNIYSFQLIGNQTIISDAKDFVQASEISIYNNKTAQLDTSFFAGTNSSCFLKIPE